MTGLRFPDPPLTDDAVWLRPWLEHDVTPAWRATQDELIPRFTRVPVNQTEEDVRRYVEEQEPARQAGEALSFVIADACRDEFLGAISLLRFDWREHRGEVGYWVASWARRRGTATRAVMLLSRWALHDLGLTRLASHADIDNEASQKVAERCGIIREGVLRSYEERSGRRHDLVVFSLLPDDLR
jgi:RimJ/RimL family protein N-acetyltransferase